MTGGCSTPMLASPDFRTLRMLARVVATDGLRLVAVAAIIACCTVFASVLADGSSDATGYHRSRIEAAAPSGSDPGCRSRCAAVLRDNRVLRRSLSQHANSLAVCEARADTLAWELHESKLAAKRLMQDNAALRRRLKAVPEAAHSPAEIPRPGTNGLQARSSHAAQLGPDPRRTAYRPTLPVSGALPSLAGVSCARPACACQHGLRLPGFCSCAAGRCASRSRGRAYRPSASRCALHVVRMCALQRPL